MVTSLRNILVTGFISEKEKCISTSLLCLKDESFELRVKETVKAFCLFLVAAYKGFSSHLVVEL